MGSLTSRGRVAVVLAFLASAGLATGAAVALVNASDGERTPGTTLPRVNPTLVFPSGTPTPSARPAPVVTATPSASAAPSASATPRPSASSTPSPRASVAKPSTYLEARASLDPGEGSSFQLVVTAVDGDDRVVLSSVEWGDGATSGPSAGTLCSAPPGGDCRVFTLDHTYAQASSARTYPITVVVTAGEESVELVLKASVAAAEPSPSASP
jgi:hypothetical protein